MDVLLRVLGIQLVARVAARLPGAVAWWATAVVLVVVNLLPLAAVLRGDAGMADVFLVYWIENVVVWATGIVRVATADGHGGPTVTSRGDRLSYAQFFALHYGLFTLVHGVFTVIVVAILGLEGGALPVAVLAGVVTAGQLFSLGVVWFGRGQQHVVSPASAMLAPYPRMLVLHVGIIIGFGVALGGDDSDQRIAVAILCVLKLLVNLAFHVNARRRLPVDDGKLYGAAAEG